jgi:hypothetical protein
MTSKEKDMDQTTQTILQTTIAGLVRHGMTLAAGALVTAGLIHSGQDSNSFVDIGSGIVIGALGMLWSWWQKVGQQRLVDEIRRLRKVPRVVTKQSSL